MQYRRFKKPYYIELPEFGKYTYDQIPQEEKPVCTHCRSDNSIGHAKGRRMCKDCNQTFRI
jgi:transposase-like protein